MYNMYVYCVIFVCAIEKTTSCICFAYKNNKLFKKKLNINNRVDEIYRYHHNTVTGGHNKDSRNTELSFIAGIDCGRD